MARKSKPPKCETCNGRGFTDNECHECEGTDILDSSAISGNDVADEIERLEACRREGSDANDHNHRVYRSGKGTLKGNPHDVGSKEWAAWRDSYAYRDMVNDG